MAEKYSCSGPRPAIYDPIKHRMHAAEGSNIRCESVRKPPKAKGTVRNDLMQLMAHVPFDDRRTHRSCSIRRRRDWKFLNEE